MPLTGHPAWSVIAGLAGSLVLALAWLGPLPALAHHDFAAHMVLHVTLVAVAAPLLALGLVGAGHTGAAAIALPASMLELLVVWAWHAPGLHQLAREHAAWFVLEQGSFLVSSLAVWWGAFASGSSAWRHTLPAGLASLLMTSTHMTLLGVLLSLAPRALYHAAEPGAAHTALAAQQAGGVVMLLGGGISYLAGALGLLVFALQAPASRPSAPAASQACANSPDIAPARRER